MQLKETGRRRSESRITLSIAALAVMLATSLMPERVTADDPIDIGDLGGGSSYATAVHNGLTVGWAKTEAGDRHAVTFTQADGLRDLATLGGTSSEANDVHDGMVVGVSTIENDEGDHAFAWTENGGLQDMETLGGLHSYAFVVHGGMAGGFSYTAANFKHGFVWTEADGILDVGTLGGTTSQITDVHGGMAAGFANTTGDMATHAVVYTIAGGLVDLGTLGGTNSVAFGVYNGMVVGQSQIAGDAASHAFYWTEADGIVDMDSLGGSNSAARAISNGLVIGESQIAGDAATHSFSFTIADGMIDLDASPDGGDSEAAAVDNEQVVGSADVSENPMMFTSFARSATTSRRAYRHKPGEGTVILNTLGGNMGQAFSTSNGVTVGSSTNANEVERGTVWIPNPCPSTPQASCRAAAKAKLLLKNNANNKKDALIVKLLKGPSTTTGEFADPMSATDYALCVYAGTSAALLTYHAIPASAASWEATPTGYKHGSGNPNGVKTKVTLKASNSNKTSVNIVAKGNNLADATLGNIDGPIIAQLIRSDSALCWEATLPEVNDTTTKLSAKTP